MKTTGIRVHAERVAYRDRIEIAVVNGHSNGDWDLGKLVFERQHPDGAITEPTLSLKTEEAQHLMDELWRCGLRPTEGTGSAGSLAAIERHLKDMQAIAFGLLDREGVKR